MVLMSAKSGRAPSKNLQAYLVDMLLEVAHTTLPAVAADESVQRLVGDVKLWQRTRDNEVETQAAPLFS